LHSDIVAAQLSHVRILRVAGNVEQGRLTRTNLLIAPGGAEEDAHLMSRRQNRAAVKGLRARDREVRGNDLDLAAVVIEGKVRLGRTVNLGSLLRRQDAVGQTAKQQ